jgi:uncharacterized repeat protein (TIGR03806 family)
MRVASRRFAAVLVAQAAAVFLVACGGGGDDDAPAPPPPPPPPVVDTTAPSIPQGVAAAAQSTTSIAVTWTASTDAGTGVAGYRVFRDSATTPVATVTATSYTDTGLTAATAYSYTVVAFDAATPANVSAASAAAGATTNSPPPPVGGTPGLDARPANTTCLAGDPPSTTVSMAVQRVFPNLTFPLAPTATSRQTIAMLQAPGDGSRWYVVQKTGSVRVFDNTPNVSTSSEFINLASRLNSNPASDNDERGLLGMAFHPDYPTNPRVYFFYTGTTGGNLVDRISEFRTLDGGATLSAGTELELLNVADPEGNHNGGNIAFGPDGFLYIGIGDGGGANDAHGSIGNGQLLTTLLGKMLRIDVANSTVSTPYAIPPSNPYAANPRCTGGTGTANCPEIFAYGFRNPWRWSFDRVSGQLWLNDVGQSALEEVNLVTLGGNYGWRCFEGTNSFSTTCGSNPNPIPPIAQYGRTLGQSTTGGVVYRGSSIPALHGRYLFGDFASGNLWHISRTTTPTMTMTAGLSTGLSIASFGQDVDGEAYIVHLGGTLHKIVPGTGGGRQIPSQLSQTGCVNASAPTQPAAGLIPYAPTAPFFSDNAVKTRWLALPDLQNITIDANNDFDFPNGSVLVKNFSIGSTLVETRLFMRHSDGNWAGYTYEWNAGGTDATRVVGGKTVTVGGQTWQFPSEAQCLQCHTAGAGRSLGLEIGTLNGNFGYPLRTANQLTTLNSIGTLTPALTQTPDQLPVIPDPAGGAPVGERARAYLHANCSYCHRPGGTAPGDQDFRYTTPLAQTNTCDITPAFGNLGITDPRRIAPGSAARSVVVARVNRTGADAMPPIMRHTIDTAGVQLLTTWVNSLTSCN